MSTGLPKYVAALSLVGVGVLLVYALQSVYTSYVTGYLDYMTMPEYSYLFVLTPLAAFLSAYLVITGFRPSRPSLSGMMASASLLLGSMFFYVLGGLDEVNGVQLYGVSFILLGLSLLLVVLRPSELKNLAAVLVLALSTVPVPLSVISYSSTFFSYVIGRLVGALMGAEIIESGSSFFLSVYDPEGVRRVFELVHACSGILSITSVLAISPIIVFVAMRSPGSVLRRAAKALLVVGAAVAIVFFGNAARVAAVLYYTKYHSYEQALEIFHQYPSFIYSVLAVVVAFYLLGKLAPPGSGLRPPIPAPPRISTKGLRTAAAALALASLIVVGIASLAPALTLHAAVAGPHSLTTLDTLVSRPASVLFNGTDVEVLVERPVPALTARLGSSSVDLVVLKYNGTTYTGYVEVAETPTRFHGWHVCLTLQGYTILRSWKEVIGDLVINYLLIRRGGDERLLGYTMYIVPFLLSNGTASAYVRVSLFVSVRNEAGVKEGAATLRKILTLPLPAEVSGGASSVFERIVFFRNVLLGTSLIIVFAIVADAVLRIVRRGRWAGVIG